MASLYGVSVVDQDVGTLAKLWHAVAGLYMWEFITTLDYEWRVIRGRIPYRWTIWIYSLTRVTGLLGVMISLVGANVTTPINCQLWISFIVILTYLSSAAASLLIVIRTIAIWNRNNVITVVAVFMWGINVAFLIQGCAQIRSAWAPTQLKCVVANTKNDTLTLIALVVTDIALLLVMLVGLLRLRRYGGGTFGVTHLLWKQGVYWLLLATAAGVPPIVLNVLDLKSNVVPLASTCKEFPLSATLLRILDQFGATLQAPALITMAIAGTRMHRSLVDFSSASFEVYERSVFTFPKAEQTHARSVSLNRMGSHGRDPRAALRTADEPL